jgi:hypothetical protein
MTAALITIESRRIPQKGQEIGQWSMGLQEPAESVED